MFTHALARSAYETALIGHNLEEGDQKLGVENIRKFYFLEVNIF